MYILVSDGGSKGNPGPSACSFGLYNDTSHQWEFKHTLYIGDTTNNVAEYHGLLYGLISIWSSGITTIKIISDSKLMVNQVNGSYQCNNDQLKSLLHQIKTILSKYSYTIEHVPRTHELIKVMDADYNICMATLIK